MYFEHHPIYQSFAQPKQVEQKATFETVNTKINLAFEQQSVGCAIPPLFIQIFLASRVMRGKMGQFLGIFIISPIKSPKKQVFD